MTVTPSGILLLDKPHGLSSNHALQRVKRALKAKKAGHAGTLDPLATGMLPILIGEATKYAQYLIDADKIYEFTVQLGVQTSTGDSEGEVVAQKRIPNISHAQLSQVINQFIGQISQVPPQYSAIKIAGKAAYQYAREGQVVEIKARTVTIKQLKLLAQHPDQLSFQVECSKGTYIRSLAEDIAVALGTVAHVIHLRRLSTGVFTADMHELADISPTIPLLAIDSMLQHIPKITVNAEHVQSLYYGQSCEVSEVELVGLARLYDLQGNFIGLGQITASGQLRPQRLLATPQTSV